jgi:hypothetical protein
LITSTVGQSDTAIPSTSPALIPSSNTFRLDLEPGSDGSPNNCILSTVLPQELDPDKDPIGTRTIFNSAIQDGTALDWTRSPALSEGKLIFQVTNISTSSEWIRLSNSIVSSISTTQNIPDHINIIHECAGTGINREFPPVILDPTYPEYKVTVKHPNADFFTLQPGELEIFNMTFTCKSPGLYRIQISIDYSIGNHTDTFSYQFPNFICPHSLTNWSDLSDFNKFVKIGSYEWNGTEYIEK